MSKEKLLDRFDFLAANVEEIVLLINNQGEVLKVSAGSEDWLLADSLVGLSFPLLFSSEMMVQVTTQINTASQCDEAVNFQYSMKEKDAPDWVELGLKEPHIWHTRCQKIDDKELIFVIADRSEEVKLERKIVNQAQRDPLTGAYNRRALMTVLSQSIAQAQRYDWLCSFLLIDIDNFTAFNESFGWDAGDLILQQLVSNLHGFKRTADFLARYGDDQFVMFLPETNSEQSGLAAERIRAMVEELEIPFSQGDLKFTVSIGASTLSDVEETHESMLRRAEENLQIAKESGHNRVEVDEAG
ncbi:MAG: GGDEF domain-containing protein [Oceanospirillaceae bacterium]|nr:GGDEF domain-containing protein [Oceanospirillaceae bacterium]